MLDVDGKTINNKWRVFGVDGVLNKVIRVY